MVTNQTIEDPHGLRMMAVLQESARKTGVRATADWLGVDRRTVLTCLSQGELTSRIRKALERELSSEATPEQTEIRIWRRGRMRESAIWKAESQALRETSTG